MKKYINLALFFITQIICIYDTKSLSVLYVGVSIFRNLSVRDRSNSVVFQNGAPVEHVRILMTNVAEFSVSHVILTICIGLITDASEISII